MSDPIKVLSMYLTDSTRVVQTSIALQVGGRMGAEAKAFYALRDSFNIRGYATHDEAETAIRQKLAELSPADSLTDPSDMGIPG